MTTQIARTTNSTSALFAEVGVLIKSKMQRVIALPFSQYQALGFIADHTRASMQEVARYFKIRAPSATFLVEELVQSGLVERHANPKDRRKVEVTLTSKGKKIFKTMQEKRDKILGGLFSSLAERDRQDLNRILQKVIDSN